MSKHRRKSKIKREHSMIEGLESFLQSIEAWPEVKSILTGTISTRKGVGGFEFSVRFETDSGLKCLAKNQGSVQEVFITTNDKDALSIKLDELEKSKI